MADEKTKTPAKTGLTDQELLNQLAGAAGKATPEQRAMLARLGVAVPATDMVRAAKGDHSLGLRCTKCNQVALYFIGTTFTDRQGQVHDEPTYDMRAHEVPWTQDLPVDQIDRNRPRCQRCFARVPLEGNGSFRIRDRGTVNGSDISRLVNVKEWEASRDRANDRNRIRDEQRKLQTGTPVRGPEADLVGPNERMSETIERLRPGAVADVDAVGRMIGAGS